MFLVAGMTLWAIVDALIIYFGNLQEFWLLASIGSSVLILDIWVLLEGLRAIRDSGSPARTVCVWSPHLWGTNSSGRSAFVVIGSTSHRSEFVSTPSTTATTGTTSGAGSPRISSTGR